MSVSAPDPTTGRRSRNGPSYAIGIWIFLRLLGIVYLVAFWSLGTQILGLAGSRGIAPAQTLMADAGRYADAGGLGLERYLQWPTLCWISASDVWLAGLCQLGMLLSLPLIGGVGGVIILPILWLLYLSLATVTGDFLAFQWDSLLLETSTVAAVLAPWRLVHRPGRDLPPRVAQWLVWWLLFRLMFASGVVKLASGDPLWRGLEALTVHFQTQPLPTPLGWYAHQLPVWFQRGSTAAVLLIELVVPWFIMAGVRWRRRAGLAFIVLQLIIALTGNYAFFNLLSAALALTLIDDATWARLVPAQWSVAGAASTRSRASRASRTQWIPAAALAVLAVPVSLDILARQARIIPPGLAWTQPVRELLLPLRSVNAYGLFAVMTPTRPEITVEGSRDGETWRPYAFRYKPGHPAKPLRWVAPHQPRLDWQMWFAALGDADENTWFDPFCQRLLEGSPEVVALLAENPFADEPPRYVRAVRAEYRMATLAERQREGVWWVGAAARPYAGPLTVALPR